MDQPLALICSGNAILSNQLANRLTDLGYRVQVLHSADDLVDQAQRAKPFLILADLVIQGVDLLPGIQKLRNDSTTRHIPWLGITTESGQEFHSRAIKSGATLVAMENGILAQLPQLLDQALLVE